MSELSVVARHRILEYQRAARRHDAIARVPDPDPSVLADLREALDDAEGKLLMLDVDPAEARRMRVDTTGLFGDR